MRISRLRSCGETVPIRSANHLLGKSFFIPGDAIRFFDSCTSAIVAALLASRPKGYGGTPEVLLPAYSSPALLQAISLTNFRPCFVDFVANKPWLDIQDLQRKLSKRTVAIILVRFMGLPTNASEVRAALGAMPITIIEDAAHYFPQSGEVNVASDATALSFNRGKPVSAGGGGALLVNASGSIQLDNLLSLPIVNPGYLARLAETVRIGLRNIAIQPLPYGLITSLLPRVSENLRYPKRHSILGIRTDHLGRTLMAVNRFRKRKASVQLEVHKMVASLPKKAIFDIAGEFGVVERIALWRYPVLFSTRQLRDNCYNALSKAGLGPSRPYETLLCERQDRASLSKHFPNAQRFSDRILTLPVHSLVRFSDILEMESIISTHIDSAEKI